MLWRTTLIVFAVATFLFARDRSAYIEFFGYQAIDVEAVRAALQFRKGAVFENHQAARSGRGDTPNEIDFAKGDRGIHQIPFLPASIEKRVWEDFSGKAEQRGIGLSELLSEVLKRDIESNEPA